MKKLTKVVAGVACLATLACGVAACGGNKETPVTYADGTYVGVYSYGNGYAKDAETGHFKGYYTAIVTVTIANGVISEVYYANDSEVAYNFSASWTNHDTALAGAQNYLDTKIVGKKPADIAKLNVACAANGEPDKGNTAGWTDYVYTGATQSSGRYILAVQNALAKASSAKATVKKSYADGTYVGAYAYGNGYAKDSETGHFKGYYTAIVTVTVSNGNVSEVYYAGDSTVTYNFSASWTNHDAALAGAQDYLDTKIVGKSAKTIAGLSVACADNGEPDKSNTAGWTDYVYTTATQSSGRYVLAIQNALAKA